MTMISQGMLGLRLNQHLPPASLLTVPSALENGPWAWQSHDFDTGYTGFDKFCDYVEVSNWRLDDKLLST